MRYAKSLPEGRFFGWDEAKALGKTHYLLMHSLIYRTSLLRECGMKLPEHTFYVDNLVAFIPLPYVKTMYYLDVNFYRYFIGRADQSVNEKVMIGRIDQQIRVMPTQVTAMGFLRLITKMGLYDSLLPLIIPSVASPAVFYFMYSYLQSSLPMSLVEAARIDGSGELYMSKKYR